MSPGSEVLCDKWENSCEKSSYEVTAQLVNIHSDDYILLTFALLTFI